jgi:glycosyltransferase involved in cell wall biosynthesis
MMSTSLAGAMHGVSTAKTTQVPVSAMIFTLDEEVHLASCLASLAWCDDVIVVDSFSRDDTERIAREAGARFYQHPFTGFGSQRNWALEHTQPKHEWVLVLDADERATPELIDEMQRVLSADTPEVGAYRVKRRFHMWGRWLRHSGLYPSYVVRLIHRDRVRYADRGHSETQTVQGHTLSLEHDLIDENLRGIDDWFTRQNRYSRKEAEYELEHSHVSSSWRSLFSRDPLERRFALRRLSWRVPGRPVVYFLYAYLWRGGWRDGRDGLTFCLMKALYQGMIATKKYDATRSRHS